MQEIQPARYHKKQDTSHTIIHYTAHWAGPKNRDLRKKERRIRISEQTCERGKVKRQQNIKGKGEEGEGRGGEGAGVGYWKV